MEVKQTVHMKNKNKFHHMLDEHHHTLHPSKGNQKSIRYQKTLSKIILNLKLPQNGTGRKVLMSCKMQVAKIIRILLLFYFILFYFQKNPLLMFLPS
jgi:hypothetical protein